MRNAADRTSAAAHFTASPEEAPVLAIARAAPGVRGDAPGASVDDSLLSPQFVAGDPHHSGLPAGLDHAGIDARGAAPQRAVDAVTVNFALRATCLVWPTRRSRCAR